MAEQLALLPNYLTAHLQLSLLALLVSTAVSIPLGIAATRSHWLEQPTLALASVIQTVPSLALLAVMVPVLASLGFQSIGFLPAFLGLTLYGLLPVLRNTVTGIAGVEPSIKEAARGVGMTSNQQLVLIELPLAMPVIVAGVRTATVWIVGIATLSTPVGATSLGNYIFSGLQTRNYISILVGCVAAAALALLLDSLVRQLENGLVHKQRRRTVAALTVLVILYGYATLTLTAPRTANQERPVVIGSKTFTEQYILSQTIAKWIERETNRSTELIQSLGSIVAFDALDSNEIDIYVDYTGTLWANEMERGNIQMNRADTLDGVRNFLRDRHNISIAASLGFENAYALAMRTNDAQRLNLNDISDLVRHAPSLAIGGDYEFFARPEWVAIQNQYGLSFVDQRTMDSTLMYEAIATRAVDVISAFSSDGRIAAYDLTVLNDDRNAIPPYDALILVSEQFADESPDIVTSLTRLEGAIDITRMRELNLRVDEDGESPSNVARSLVNELTSSTLRAR